MSKNLGALTPRELLKLKINLKKSVERHAIQRFAKEIEEKAPEREIEQKLEQKVEQKTQPKTTTGVKTQHHLLPTSHKPLKSSDKAQISERLTNAFKNLFSKQKVSKNLGALTPRELSRLKKNKGK